MITSIGPRLARKPAHQTGLGKSAQWQTESDGSLRGGVQRIRTLVGREVSTGEAGSRSSPGQGGAQGTAVGATSDID